MSHLRKIHQIREIQFIKLTQACTKPSTRNGTSRNNHHQDFQFFKNIWKKKATRKSIDVKETKVGADNVVYRKIIKVKVSRIIVDGENDMEVYDWNDDWQYQVNSNDMLDDRLEVNINGSLNNRKKEVNVVKCLREHPLIRKI